MDGHVSLRVGIMQGRLVPPLGGRIQAFPRERWRDEFALARNVGFDALEFIFDADDAAAVQGHPLLEEDCSTIRSLVERSGVAVSTICADYFIRHPVHGADRGDAERSVALLERLIANTRDLGVTDIVLPCVDESSFRDDHDRASFVRGLAPVLDRCDALGVNLALETDLPPKEFVDLLETMRGHRVTVNYDVGNSASLGYEPVDEWAAYGDRVSSVHVKDRLRGGSTVPLGSGAVDFERFFSTARQHGYRGLFLIQGARGADDIETARRYKTFVDQHLRAAYGS